MATNLAMQQIIGQKLETFQRLQPEFERSFLFVQDVHGQRRFPSFPVSFAVRYLHALWVCECKGRLLSVQKTVKEYEGRRCLELLRDWQEGDTASVIAFLHRKLDMLPFADLTRQIQEVSDEGLARRLVHGRLVLLNRGMNLMQALDAIFALSDELLLREVREECAQLEHQPEQIEQQLAEMDTLLYAYVPHQMLAQLNMIVMNALGVNVASNSSDLPGHRSWRVLAPIEPLHPYAEHVVEGYQELVAPTHNTIRDVRFVDRQEGDSDAVL